MITLTTPAQINSVLGGNAPVAYNKLVLTPFTMTPLDGSITGRLRLTSTTNPEMQEIMGSLQIRTASGELIVEVAQLDFYRRIQLDSAQLNSVSNIIRNAQNSIESGLVTLGVVAGTQAPGA